MKTINYNPNDTGSQGADAGDRGRAPNGDIMQWTGANWQFTGDNPGPSGASGRGGGSSSGGSSGDWQSMLQTSIDMAKKANEPAVATLQGGISPLKEQYAKLLESINAQKGVAVNQKTVNTNAELAKRGISNESGLAATERTNALSPLDTQYGALANSATMGQTQDINSINAAIAQLQSGGAMSAMSTGSNLYQNQQNLAQQKAQADAANAIAQGQLANQTKQTNYDTTNKPYTTTPTTPTNYNTPTTPTKTNDVWTIVTTPTKSTNTFIPQISTNTGVKTYGGSPYASYQ